MQNSHCEQNSQSKKNTFEIREATLADLAELVPLHMKTFAGTMGVALGRIYVYAFLRWYIKHPNAVYIILLQDSKIMSFVFGSKVSSARLMNKEVGLFAAIGMILHPKLFMTKNFRNELLSRVKILLGLKKAEEQTLESETEKFADDTYSLVGIGSAPQAQGKGFAKYIIKAFEDILCDKGVSVVWLSVEPENNKARELYKKSGWQESDHRNNERLLYLSKQLQKEL